MISFECKSCGARISAENGATFGQCEYCGISAAVPDDLYRKTNSAPEVVSAKPIADAKDYAQSLISGMNPQAGRLVPYMESFEFQSKQNAILGFDFRLATDEYSIVLWDDAFRKNGKSGLLLTSKALYYRNALVPAVKVEWNSIESIDLMKTYIIAFTKTEKHSAQIAMCDAALRPSIADMVNKVRVDFTR